MLPDLGQQSLCWDGLLADEATVMANRSDGGVGGGWETRSAAVSLGNLNLTRFYREPTGRVRIKSMEDGLTTRARQRE